MSVLSTMVDVSTHASTVQDRISAAAEMATTFKLMGNLAASGSHVSRAS